MLSPKRTKYRKYQKGLAQGISPNTTQLEFGKFGLKSLQSGLLKARTIEAVRRAMTRKFKRSGQIWIRIFPDIPVTMKPAEARMGKGKGAVSHWICRVKCGQILFEMDGIPLQIAKQAALLACNKMPIPTKFIIMEK
jgi:large subunit ribosomal protein L16